LIQKVETPTLQEGIYNISDSLLSREIERR
jgi:hypothetical protein